MLFSMASSGLPATSGFVGEILVIVGTYHAAPWATAWAATGLVLGAAYMLWLYRRVVFGDITNPHVGKMRDVSRREWLYLAPLAVAVMLLGVYPRVIMQSISPTVTHLLSQVEVSPTAEKPEAEVSAPVAPLPVDATDKSSSDTTEE
jgi:NADH-quinone oxidoreductase subunit M